MPARCAYADWRAMHMPMLEGLLHQLERDAERWDDFKRLCRDAQAMRDRGLHVEDPAEPELTFGLLLWLLLHAPEYALWLLHATEYAPAYDRAELVAALQNRRHQLPDTFTVEDFVRVLTGEALAAGIACDYATPYQAWWVIAELLLRDEDIGEISARVHPERCDPRSPRSPAEELHKSNIDRARKERKRVNRKREAFGYRMR